MQRKKSLNSKRQSADERDKMSSFATFLLVLVFLLQVVAGGIALFQSSRAIHELPEVHSKNERSLAESNGNEPSQHADAKPDAKKEGSEEAKMKSPEEGEKPAGEGSPPAPKLPEFDLGEIMANPSSLTSRRLHIARLRLALDLYSLADLPKLDSVKGVLRDLAIETVKEASYEDLQSLPGKLYWKEVIVQRMNEFFKKPLIRDVHFTSFYIQ